LVVRTAVLNPGASGAALAPHGMAFEARDHGRGRHQLCLAHLVTAAGAMSP
jgi:hypothetical protein